MDRINTNILAQAAHFARAFSVADQGSRRRNEFAQDFGNSICRQIRSGKTLSAKQVACLDRLCTQLGVEKGSTEVLPKAWE